MDFLKQIIKNLLAVLSVGVKSPRASFPARLLKEKEAGDPISAADFNALVKYVANI